MTTLPAPTAAVVRPDAEDTPIARAEPAATADFEPLPLGQRVVNLIFILVPLCALVWAVVYAWGRGVGWTELGLMFGFYILTGFGITVGYHRLFTPKSFRTGKIMTTKFTNASLIPRV